MKQKTKDSLRFTFTFTKGWIFIIGILLGLLLSLFLTFKSLTNVKMFLGYYIIGIIFVLIVLSGIGWVLSNLFLKFSSLKKVKKYQNIKDAEVAIILGYDGLRIIGNLFISTYLGVGYLLDYLKPKRIKVYITPSKKEFNKILKDKKIKTIYLIGHGSSRGFELNKNEGISYSDYKNSKIVKDEIHLYHCGHGDGKTLIEYLVRKENQKKCHNYNDKEMVISYILDFYDLYKQQLKQNNLKK